MNPSSPAFFEAKYRAAADPWNFAGSDYERSRYEATVAALDGRHFRRALEPGCSVGVLTQQLATRCAWVDAFDFSPTAVEAARQRCAALPNVALRCDALSPALPFGRYDLIVLSEIGYYFTDPEWAELAATLVSAMTAGSTLLAVHWLGKSSDHRLSGDRVHQLLGGQPGLSLGRAERFPQFRLDRWSRT